MLTRPTPAEYLPFAHGYVQRVPNGQHPIDQLRTQLAMLKELLAGLTNAQALYRYAPGKWSTKESLVHIIDSERIFAYRALRIGRGDQTPLPGFNQDLYVPTSEADARPLADIWREYDAVRAATLSLFDSFAPAVYDRTGQVGGAPLSVRALAYMIPGHEAHHIALFRERYLPGLA